MSQIDLDDVLFSTEQLEAMDRISEGHSDDLYIKDEEEGSEVQVWLSRVIDNEATVCVLDKNDYSWKQVFTYPADGDLSKDSFDILNVSLYQTYFE